MRVKVRLSGGLARLVGLPRLQVEVEEQATVGILFRRLEEGYPFLAPHLPTAIAIVHGDHAGMERELAHDEEVALLVPVAGG